MIWIVARCYNRVGCNLLLLALAAVSKGADASIGSLYGSLERCSVAVVSKGADSSSGRLYGFLELGSVAN